jgi:benzoylformate decarboxylase/acetolactate synthase-1/2/3 large subunit
MTPERRRVAEERGRKLAAEHKRTRDRDFDLAGAGWEASPITTARQSAELYNVIRKEDWSFVSDTTFISWWPLRLWNFDKHYQFIGGHGA